MPKAVRSALACWAGVAEKLCVKRFIPKVVSLTMFGVKVWIKVAVKPRAGAL